MNSQMNSSPVPFNLNGGVDMQNFLGLLEHEEADFVEQVKKSKAFIQKIIKAELQRRFFEDFGGGPLILDP